MINFKTISKDCPFKINGTIMCGVIYLIKHMMNIPNAIPEKGHPLDFNEYVNDQFKRTLKRTAHKTKSSRRRSVRARAARLIETVMKIMNDKIEEVNKG